VLAFPVSQAKPQPQEFQVSSDRLTAFAGQYEYDDDPDLIWSVSTDGSRLFMESQRSARVELVPQSEDSFSPLNLSVTLKFIRSPEGNIAGFNRVAENGTRHARKISGQPLAFRKLAYTRQDAMIPMRDGVKLHAAILRPKGSTAPLPFLMVRTPYGVDGNTPESINSQQPELAANGYIFVFEDIRGRYKSEGTFAMMRPMADHRDPKLVDESTDAYDTVAWLLKNVPNNNGRVGVFGVSYPGFLAVAAGIDPHPAVKAISPQAPMIDVWMGDDFFHNGAFRQSYSYDYVLGIESSKQTSSVSYGAGSVGHPTDGFDYFLERGSFAEDVKQSGSGLLPTWKLFLDHPAYGKYWRALAVEYALNSVSVPTLTVGGYYDQEDMWGPQEEYARLQQHNTAHDNFLVLGPWRHGSWSSSSRYLGNLDYGEPIGDEYRAEIEARFFAHYLKDEPGFELANAASFQTGSNAWKYYAEFPPRGSRPTALHLAGSGVLSSQSSTISASTSYVSDPADPVPYRHRPIQPTYSTGSEWYNWLTEDQRFVTGRRDVAVWKLPVLDHDLTLTGEVVADIFASTTGSDNDLVVKLIDQYPDGDPNAKMRGYQLLTNAEIFRGRYLSGFDNPTALKPGAAYEYKFSLHAVDHVFKTGHTVMVEIQSTWFPLYDRNPQTFVPNIMNVKPSDFRPATVTILTGADHDSKLLLPVMPTP